MKPSSVPVPGVGGILVFSISLLVSGSGVGVGVVVALALGFFFVMVETVAALGEEFLGEKQRELREVEGEEVAAAVLTWLFIMLLSNLEHK
jgi:hypothetical protein